MDACISGLPLHTIQARQLEKVPNYFGIGQTIVTFHDSMNNVSRGHIAEVKENKTTTTKN